MMKMIKRVVIVLISLIILLLIAFYLWAVLPYSVMEKAELAMISDATVEVIIDKDIQFIPRDGSYTKGLIIYPGTRVDSEAYSYSAKAIAAEGFLVVLANMPLDISILKTNKALSIQKSFPQVSDWAVAGHSLGGASAAFFAKDNPEVLDALIFLAAYPGENTDLSDSGLKVLSLYGSNDGVAMIDEIMKKKHLLPSDTLYVEVKGGNHAGFAHYGDQEGDGKALIDRIEQQDFIVDQITEFLKDL